MSRSRLPLVLGLTAAGGIGYYLYQAGGEPKAAEKRFESDVHKAAAQFKGRGSDAEKEAKRYGQEAGAKVDSVIASADKEFAKAKAEASKAKSDAEAYAKGVSADARKKIDEVDRKVEEGSAKAKSSISSWFGGK